MKKLILILTAIIVTNIGRGQSFEGTMTYTMTMKVTDLTARRDIAEAKKEITSIEKQVLPASDFEIPSGYMKTEP